MKQACAAALMAVAMMTGSTALAQDKPTLPDLSLEFLFEEDVALMPGVAVGTTPYGCRSIAPIAGGTFKGPSISGKVLPGAGTGSGWAQTGVSISRPTISSRPTMAG